MVLTAVGIFLPDSGTGTGGNTAIGTSACTHAKNVLNDMGTGVLTVSEFRSKLKQVQSDAASDDRLYGYATQMLADVTQMGAFANGDEMMGFDGSLSSFKGRCRELAHW